MRVYYMYDMYVVRLAFFLVFFFFLDFVLLDRISLSLAW